MLQSGKARIVDRLPFWLPIACILIHRTKFPVPDWRINRAHEFDLAVELLLVIRDLLRRPLNVSYKRSGTNRKASGKGGEAVSVDQLWPSLVTHEE
jgi:hypothetical protein